MSDSLRPRGLQHARLLWPAPSPGVSSNSCPLSWWCNPTISFSVVPFSSRLQSFPASGSFPMSQVFALGGHKYWSFSFNISPSSEHPGLICIIGVVHFYYFYSRPVVSPGGNFVPLGTLGHVWRHFWLSQPVEGQMLLAFSRWKPGMLPSIPPSTGGSPQQRMIRLQMPGVPRWRSPALRHRNPAC